MLNYIEINHKSPKISIIFLHGLGADGSDFADIADQFPFSEDCGVRFIFPHAPFMPVTFAHGDMLRAWFDITSLTARGINENAASIYAMQKEIDALIANEIARGILHKNIFLAGFSQGGAMALQCGLRFNKSLGGILVLSGFLPLADELPQAINIANKKTPILILHGTLDHVVTLEIAQSSYKKLQDCNLDVTWRDYPMRHTVCPEEIQDIGEWVVLKCTTSA